MASEVVENKPYDEALELTDDEASPVASPTRPASDRTGGDETVQNKPYDEAVELTDEDSADEDESPPTPAANSCSSASNATNPSTSAPARKEQRAENEEFSDGDDEQPSPAGQAQDTTKLEQSTQPVDAMVEGGYDPKEYADLDVSDEIKELFQYITRYKPHNIDLETKMRPFLPDYVPAISEPDPFVKVPRPDGKADNLGLCEIDEPAAKQTDPAVMTMQLRAVMQTSSAIPSLVRTVEQADRNPRAIDGTAQLEHTHAKRKSTSSSSTCVPLQHVPIHALSCSPCIHVPQAGSIRSASCIGRSLHPRYGTRSRCPTSSR